MTNQATRRLLVSLIALPPLLALSLVAVTNAQSDFLEQPAWEQVSTTAVERQLEAYLSSDDITPVRRSAARDAWEENTNSEPLDRLAGAFAKADDRVAELVGHCQKASSPGVQPEFEWLADSETPIFVSHNMRLYLARWLVQQGYYDEALGWTEGLSNEDVITPDALLFYRAVAHHRLVQPDKADAVLAQLLQREDDLPARYQKLAELMRQDVASLEDESLDHIARRMEDVRRRLAQGSSGERVQGVENGVIESLDKIIDKIEKQLQQQQQSQASSSGGSPQQGGTPMQDSRIAELKAPGKVEPRNIGRGTGWGNLPDKEREQALQEIGREFPSHYREVIEEYFRRLAAEESDNAP